MKVRLPKFARRATRAAIIPVAALSLWSCTTAGNDVAAGLPAYDSASNMANTSPTLAATADAQQAQEGVAQKPAAASAANPPKPGEQTVALAVPTPSAGDAPPLVEDEAPQTAATATTPTGAEPVVAAAKPDAAQPAVDAAQPAVDPATAGDGSVATAAAAPPAPPKKTGLFAFFGSSKSKQPPQPAEGVVVPAKTSATRSAVAKAPGQAALNAAAGAPAELNMAALDVPGNEDEAPTTKRRQSASAEDGGLPGVRQSALFEIKRRSGLDDDSDVDLYENAPRVQMASVGGMSRGANGLLKQREDVDVSCLKPGLVRILRQIEAKYGRKLVVTSGYRSPAHNRRARGAKNSQHMYCAAADIQVPGVSKWELARFARSMPGRGGVGTYCHTESIHVDVGPNRDWNWRCRGRRK